MSTAKKPAPPVLSIDDILAADDLRTATVDCPEWGGLVEVRALSRQEVVDAIEASTSEVEELSGDGGTRTAQRLDEVRMQMELVWRGMGLTKDRVAQLDGKHPGPIKRIELKVRELSGLLATDPLD